MSISRKKNIRYGEYSLYSSNLRIRHAIYYAKSFVGNEPFAVLLGDDIVYNKSKPCLKQRIDAYDEYNSSILGV